MAFAGGLKKGDASTAVTLSPVMGANAARLLGAQHVRLETEGMLCKLPLGQGKQESTVYHQDFPGHNFDRPAFLSF